MNVLLMSWGRHGGGPRYALELARELVRISGIVLHLSVSRQAELYPEFCSVPVQGRFDVDTYSSLTEFVLGTLGLRRLCSEFGRYIERNGIEVVLCAMDHMWSSFAAQAAKKAGATYVLTLHDAVRHPGEDSAVRAWLLRRDIMRADAVITLSEAVRAALLERYGYPQERVYRIPHGVFNYGEAREGRTLPSDRPIRLLFFGRILEYKGLDILLEAFPHIRRMVGDVRLHICGKGELGQFAGLLRRLEGVEVTNRWITEQEMPGVFANADLVVLPYREASQSGVIAAAAGFGVPCVVTPVGGLREQVGNGAYGVIASGVSAPAVAEAVAGVLRSPELYRRLSERCIQISRGELSWEVIADKIAAVLTEVAASRSGGSSGNMLAG